MAVCVGVLEVLDFHGWNPLSKKRCVLEAVVRCAHS